MTPQHHSPEYYLVDRPMLTDRQRRLAWLCLPLILGGLCGLPATTGWLDSIEQHAIDARFRARGPLKPDRRIVIVQITEASRRQLTESEARFDLRDNLDDAVRRLADAGAVAIGLDLWLQGQGDPEVDRKLAETIRESNTVLGVAVANNVYVRAAKVFRQGKPDEGSLVVTPDDDGVLRRLPDLPNLDLLDTQTGKPVRIPHFPFVLAYLLLADEAERAGQPAPALDLPATGRARLGPRVVRYGQLVNYAAGPGEGFTTIELADIVRGRCNLSAVDGAVVLIGTTRSLEDQFRLPICDHLIPGVYYHANVIDMILQNRMLGEWPASRGRVALLAAAVAAVTGWYFFNLRAWWMRTAGWLLLVAYLIVGAVAFVAAWWLLARWAFSRNVVLPVVPVLTAVGEMLLLALVSQLSLTIASARRLALRNRHIEALLGRNVSAQVLEAIKANPVRIARTELRVVSVLFCDIRSFTTTSTQLTPEGVAAMLNEYYEAITSAVFERDGFVDKFVGDELMAVFGTPVEQPDHVLRAARSAIAIKQKLQALNVLRAGRGEKPLDCGVGIHCGPAAAGPIGTANRANYTVVGNTVNVAARIQGLTKSGEILVSQEVSDQLNGQLRLCLWKTVELRGATGTYQLYELDPTQAV